MATLKRGGVNVTSQDKIDIKTDLGLQNVDNTSDANKPVSSATQTALDAKAATSHTQAASTISDSTIAGRALLTAADAAAQRTALGLGTASTTAATDYATAAQGVTNGNSHDHNGGDGAQIAYSSLSGLPTLPTGTNTGDQTISNTSDATSHTVTLSGSGGSVQFVEGSNITLTTTGTSGAGVVTIASTASGSGTVTSASVVSANGFAGTVANATTTPAITLTTSITGLLKGNGTAISAATAATDYAAAGAVGSTGITMSTARLLGRSTAGTGAVEEIVLGTNLSFSGTTLNATGGSGGGDVSAVGSPTSGQAAEWTSATSIQGVAVTGTGNYVRATSPTLVTPALGTPASGVLTNATGLPPGGITMSTARLIGRSTAGTGVAEEIVLGTNLSFTGTTLNATGGGGALTTSAAAVTGSNVTGVDGTLHAFDLSGLTAARSFVLPTTAPVDTLIGVVITATHATAGRELIITAGTGQTLAGIAGGTEWSRIWQVGESLIFRCIVANTTWVIEHDGRIQQLGGIALTGSDITSGPAANTWAKINCNTSLFARGCTVDTSANTIIWRRASYVSISASWAPRAGATFTDNELSGWAASYDGTPGIGTSIVTFTSNHPGTTARARPGSMVGIALIPAGKSIQLNQYAATSADIGARALNTSTNMIVQEILL